VSEVLKDLPSGSGTLLRRPRKGARGSFASVDPVQAFAPEWGPREGKAAKKEEEKKKKGESSTPPPTTI